MNIDVTEPPYPSEIVTVIDSNPASENNGDPYNNHD
jgi:hypothetical protein